MKWWEKPKQYMTDGRFMQEVLTISKLLLALIIFIVTFGIIDDFSREALVTMKSGVRFIGFFLTLDIITNALSERAEYDAKDEEEEIQRIQDKGIEETQKIDEEKAIVWVSELNERDRKNEVEKKRQRKKNEMTEEISQWQAKYDRVRRQPYRFFQIYKKHKRKKYKRKLEKLKWKRSQLDNIEFVVRFDSIEVDDLKFRGGSEGSGNNTNKRKRYNRNASKPVRRRLRYKNLFQALLFFGLQGAILINATTVGEAIVYLLIMIPTFITAAFVAYIYTYRRATGTWLADQKDKLKDLERMNRDIEKNPQKYIMNFDTSTKEEKKDDGLELFESKYD